MSYVEQCPHGPLGWCLECEERKVKAYFNQLDKEEKEDE